MSSALLALALQARFGERHSNRKVAMMALANAANDRGEGIGDVLADFCDVIELSAERAKKVRAELRRVGLIMKTSPGGNGAGDRAVFAINVALLRRMAEGELTYAEMLAPNKGVAGDPLISAEEGGHEGGHEGGREGGHEGGREGGHGKIPPTPPYKAEDIYSLSPPLPPSLEKREREQVADRLIDKDQARTVVPEAIDEAWQPEAGASEMASAAAGWAAEAQDQEVARRLGWLAEVAADGRHPVVVEAFLRPMLATLTVPKGRQPVEFLRDLRDAAAAAKAPRPALEAAAKAARRDRVRDLPWPKDVGRLIEQASLAAKVQLAFPDPRWHAWLAHDMRDPAKSSFAKTTRERRWGYVAESDWPPPSPEIDASRRPLEIAWGTPEHAAWLGYWRNTGRAAIAQGHDMKGPGSSFLSPERWPTLLGPSDAHTASGPATSGRAQDASRMAGPGAVRAPEGPSKGVRP